MSEVLSTPDQNKELADTLYFASAAGGIVTQSITGDYFQRASVMPVPENLRVYLPPLPADTRVTATVKAPLDGHMPDPTLRLSWKYDPVAEAAGAGEQDAQSRADQKGYLFTTWRADISLREIQRVSGLYDQLPESAFPAPGSSPGEAIKKMIEVHDELRLMAETAGFEAWERVKSGFNSPRITFDEAAALIGFAKILRNKPLN